MRLLISFELLQFAVLAAASSGTVYITDLPGFTDLAPCAATGVSYAVQGLTESACPPGVTELASCACTKDSNSAVVSKSISTEVLNYCLSTASEDVTSAESLFNIYCNQGGGVTAAASTTAASGITVSQFVTDLSAYNDLAPCAASALSYGLNSLTSDCPQGASGFQSCACTKDQNSLKASGIINSEVSYYCGSTHTEDRTSAQSIFAGYCGLPGTSVFPSPSYLPGSVTYYITDLPQFSSLAPCAASAVSYQMREMTQELCPNSPLALVSCACVKDDNSVGLSSNIVTEVKYSCSSTASADVTSALSVFAYYCSAGQGLVTPQGVTASALTSPGSNPTSGAKTTSVVGAGGSTSTSVSDPSNTSTSDSNIIKKIPIPAIIGGGVGLLVLLSLCLICIRRYRRSRMMREPAPPYQPPYQNTPAFGGFEPKPNSNEASTPFTVSPLMGKLSPMEITDNRPVSPMEETVIPPPQANNERSEMFTPAGPERAELQPATATIPPTHAELPNSTSIARKAVPIPELPLQQAQSYQLLNQHPSPVPSPDQTQQNSYPELIGNSPEQNSYHEFPGSNPQQNSYHEFPGSNPHQYYHDFPGSNPQQNSYHEFPSSNQQQTSYHEFPGSTQQQQTSYHEFPANAQPQTSYNGFLASTQRPAEIQGQQASGTTTEPIYEMDSHVWSRQ